MAAAARGPSVIRDTFETIDQVQSALLAEGLESSNLIIGIDCTGSNTQNGARTFGGRSLHDLSQRNPYQHAISIIGKTLEAMDDDKMIPTYGFGDAQTGAQAVFSFLPNDQPCETFEGVLEAYRAVMPHVELSGPTSFAPLIRKAIEVVKQNDGAYHILLIVADGQIGGVEEQQTVAAIVDASKWALSIIMVGVGDGPWDQMETFDDNLPARDFDNFQFVNFSEMAARNSPHMEAMFARNALMEIPEQYKTIKQLGLLGNTHRGERIGKLQPVTVFDPPSSATL
eukprot:TRINITY_DN268_c0_g1_i3.p1 TRINITY_DN268_c0_g1~~TRINITY_DN268_c0_g1_i3.p1  ORF type:complete len:298 (-),score=74.83 TRINITY_DN268_c0_g1_i3:65-916(-)